MFHAWPILFIGWLLKWLIIVSLIYVITAGYGIWIIIAFIILRYCYKQRKKKITRFATGE